MSKSMGTFNGLTYYTPKGLMGNIESDFEQFLCPLLVSSSTKMSGC